MTQKSKTILLGVTGGIAAYKSADLCSRLVKAGWQVQVVMTENATKFVTPLTFQTLSRQAVVTSLWEVPDWRPEHVALAEAASLLVIAPCTANMLGKISGGIADDALSTLAVSFRGRVLLAPAMNPAMWSHDAVRENVATLRRRGYLFEGPDAGHVACGADGVGRMAEPEAIFRRIEAMMGQQEGAEA